MVIFFSAILNEIYHLGRNYDWPKPKHCPHCNSCRVWGHGFFWANFDGFDLPLILKRFRCPDCKCVIRLRPSGYFKRFQATKVIILASISSKVKTGKWLDGICRNRQRHWYNALLRKIAAHLTNTWHPGLIAGFDRLCELGHIPTCRSI